MTIANRLRGTYGWFAKVNGVVLGLLVYLVFGNLYVSLAVAIGYVLGESFGWGEWVGNLSVHRKETTDTLEDEGKNNGIQYVAIRLVPNWSVAYLKYCRVALVLRGLYWWTPTLIALCFIVNPLLVVSCMVVLAICFPLACELGYITSKLWNFKYMDGGWEHSEVWYGLFQDLVIFSLIFFYLR